MIVLLDHDDSFVHTLARYVAELGEEPLVVRARHTTVTEIAALSPSRIILSPGPCTPRECPVAVNVVRRLGSVIPVLGVCLGHQCIGVAYGAKVARTSHPRHGRTSPIAHDGRGVFAGAPSPLMATRYHSLAIVAESVPEALKVTATADDGDIMGIRHRSDPVEGVQFHPESVLTEWGHLMLANFLGRPTAGLGAVADAAILRR
ncbi:MAG: aminodeoxychorismate/anthranilate synthase component II [Gemmatimonadota bacterium]